MAGSSNSSGLDLSEQEQALLSDGRQVGSVKRTSMWRDDASRILPGLPVPVQLFVLAVVLTMSDRSPRPPPLRERAAEFASGRQQDEYSSSLTMTTMPLADVKARLSLRWWGESRLITSESR